jgi:hypothetical protein
MPALGVFAIMQVWAGRQALQHFVLNWRPEGVPAGWEHTDDGIRMRQKLAVIWGRFQVFGVQAVAWCFFAVAALMVSSGGLLCMYACMWRVCFDGFFWWVIMYVCMCGCVLCISAFLFVIFHGISVFIIVTRVCVCAYIYTYIYIHMCIHTFAF